MEVKLITFLFLMASSVFNFCEGVTVTEFIQLRSAKDVGRTARMTLGTKVGTAECAQIGRNCAMQRDRSDSPTSFTYVPCCQHLTCQGIGPVERRNGLGQAHSSDDNYFSGICTVSLDNGGGDLEIYKEYLSGL